MNGKNRLKKDENKKNDQPRWIVAVTPLRIYIECDEKWKDETLLDGIVPSTFESKTWQFFWQLMEMGKEDEDSCCFSFIFVSYKLWNTTFLICW
jgi:hypothetical protein